MTARCALEAAVALAAALGSGLLILALRPVLARYALARPNARSAHSMPTPQGGGIAVIAAVLAGTAGAAAAIGLDADGWARLGLLAGAAVGVALLGLVDDIRPLPALPRLGLQLVAMAVAVAALPEGARILPFLPLAVERAVLVVGGAWFVNLTNFIDGMDGLTVVDTVPLTAALVLFWHWGFLSTPAGLVALALCGGMIGFAPFNAPVARLFLGDVGSLPIGLLVAFLLYDLASHGRLAAAILLPLYAIADSGITLLWRLSRGERVWDAHRRHFYQVATARGLSVRQVLARVAALNVGLAVLAALALRLTGAMSVAPLVGGAVAVGFVLRGLGFPKRIPRR